MEKEDTTMKLEYTRPEIEVTLFSTESIMADSAVTGGNTTISMPVSDELPGEISANTWNI